MSELVEFFQLHMQLSDAQTLSLFISGTAAASPQLVEACHLMATDERVDMHLMHKTAFSISNGQRGLEARCVCKLIWACGKHRIGPSAQLMTVGMQAPAAVQQATAGSCHACPGRR